MLKLVHRALFEIGSVFLLGANHNFAPDPLAFLPLNQDSTQGQTLQRSVFKSGIDALRETLEARAWQHPSNEASIIQVPTGRHWIYTTLLMQEVFAYGLTYGRNDAHNVAYFLRVRGWLFDQESNFSKL